MEIGKFKIMVQMREGAMVGYPNGVKPSIEEGDFLLIILDDINRKYSVGIKVTSVTNHDDLTEPTMIIDSRIAGEIASEDHVRVIKTRAPEASYVELMIPDISSIYQGDWTTVIKPQLQEKICDYGDDLRFSTPTKDGAEDAINLIEGTVLRTYPPAPVKIGSETTIKLLKRSPETIQDFKEKQLIDKKTRAENFLVEIEKKMFDIVREMKSGELETYSRKYEFKTRPEDFYNSLRQLLDSNYTSYDNQIYFKEITDDDDDITIEKLFSGTMSYFSTIDGLPNVVIEALINGKDDKCNMILTVYSKNKIESMQFIEEQLHDKIFNISKGIAIQAEIALESCSCGAIFNISEANVNGWIKCKNCDLISQLPAKYRNIKI